MKKNVNMLLFINNFFNIKKEKEETHKKICKKIMISIKIASIFHN